ncbi:MAG TPA: hypothetical protein VHL53_07610, partial [Acidimicrobiia bacterium]|nr:hypothetical protein [Acidimicrobiia bacterium]
KFIRTQWDRVGAWVLVAAAAVALLLGWLGVTRTAFPAEQIPYIVSGGLLAVCLVAVGAMLWLSADLRDEWRKLDAIEDALRHRDADPADRSPDIHDHAAIEATTAASPVEAVRR